MDSVDSTQGPSAASPVTDSTEPPDIEAVQATPTDAAIADILGYSISQTTAALDEARFDYIVDCMVADGWDYDRSMLPSHEDPASIDNQPEVGGAARNAIELITALEEREQSGTGSTNATSATTPESSNDEDMFAAEAQCFEQAVEEYPDPVEDLYVWVATEQEDLNAIVEADPRYLEAVDEQQRCIADTGHPFTPQEASNHFQQLVNEIVDQYRQDDLGGPQALEELSALETEEDQVAEDLTPCLQAFLETVRMVRADAEEAWLEENGERLAVALNDLVDLDPLREQLERIADDPP